MDWSLLRRQEQQSIYRPDTEPPHGEVVVVPKGVGQLTHQILPRKKDVEQKARESGL